MNASQSSCLTLAAIAGISAAIATGILGVSPATAEPATPRSVPASPARNPSSVRLPESSPQNAQSLSNTQKFDGTEREFSAAVRASMVRPFDPEDESRFHPAAPRGGPIAVGPDPCGACDPEDVDNPSSPNYDPTILAVYQENDVLPPPDGPGFATCNGLSATGPFWAGANDHCTAPSGAAGRDPAFVDRQLPVFTSIGQRYQICGRIGLIDTSGFTGSPNIPGSPPAEPLKSQDQDIWEMHVAAGLNIRLSGYMQSGNLQVIVTFNLDTALEFGTFDQFRDCNDRYGIFNAWLTPGFTITVPCTEDGEWSEYLAPGYYYLYVDPLAAAPQGTPGAQLCEYWYNLVAEVIDPAGACCLGASCQDNVPQTACWAMAGSYGSGVFRGGTCIHAICCDVLAELAAQGLAADYTEGDTGFNPFTEKRCNVAGSTDTNPGCSVDGSGLPIPNFPDAGEPVQNSSGQLLDVCADPDKFVVIGYSGTSDSFDTTFLTSQFPTTADTDMFVFENFSGASQLLSFDGFAAATGVFQYQNRAGSYPDGGALGYACDISGFVGELTGPCEHVHIADCVPDQTTWAFGFRNFETRGISCDTPYWFSVDCAPCPKIACCLPSGSCVDGLDENQCNDFLDPSSAGGVGGADWSSCCYVTCPDVCASAGILSGSVADDNCETVNPSTGDLFNSGCDAPDGNPLGKFSAIGYPGAQSWCGSTGTYVLTLPSQDPTVELAETDYYLIDLSSAPNDIGVRITVTPSSSMSMYLVPRRGEGDCPQTGIDGTTDVRELDDTQSFGLDAGAPREINLCLGAHTKNMLLFEATQLVACGTPYHVEIRYFTEGCLAACCDGYLNHAGSGAQGCTLLADVATTLQDEAAVACASSSLRGTYRGLNTRCTGVEAVACCTVAQVGGDLLDIDNGACPASNAADANRGCVAPAGGVFQALGTFTPGVGPSPGTTIHVYGAVCRSATGTTPPSDKDFYSVNVNSASGAEYLCTVESSARILVAAYSASDLGLPSSCNINSSARDMLFTPTTPCTGPATVAGSGLSAEGNIFCLLGNQLNYFLVQPSDSNDGIEARYRMTLTAYQCREGACCLDAALCFDDAGFLECEAVSGGQFIAGASCPDDAAGLALCRGVCCVDASGPGVPICVPNTTAYDCCALLNCGAPQSPATGCSFAADSQFAGYTAGDEIFNISCASNTDICEEGACCIDTVSGYTCQDNLSAVQCSSLSGLFQGIGAECADIVCPEHPCCLGTTCAEGYSPLECANVGGTYKPLDASCAAVACTPTGACCFSCAGTVVPNCPDPSGPVQGCVILTNAQCLAARGLYVGNTTTCTQGVGGPCDCSGDVNGDGNTNISDFNILSGQFGQGNPTCRTHTQGDLNCDGIVNVSDFNILSGNFGCARH